MEKSLTVLQKVKGFPVGSVGKESILQCRGDRFNSWVWKILRSGKASPVFWPENSHGLYELDTLISDFHFHFQKAKHIFMLPYVLPISQLGEIKIVHTMKNMSKK